MKKRSIICFQPTPVNRSLLRKAITQRAGPKASKQAKRGLQTLLINEALLRYYENLLGKREGLTPPNQ